MYIGIAIIIAVALLIVIGATRDKAKPRQRNPVYLTGYGPEYRKVSPDFILHGEDPGNQDGSHQPEDYGQGPGTYFAPNCADKRKSAGGYYDHDAYRSQFDRDRQAYFQEMASGSGSQGDSHWTAPEEHPEYDSPIEIPAPAEAPIRWDVFINANNKKG